MFRNSEPSFPVIGRISILISHCHKLPLFEDKFLLVRGTYYEGSRTCQIGSRIFDNIHGRTLQDSRSGESTKVYAALNCFYYTSVLHFRLICVVGKCFCKYNSSCGCSRTCWSCQVDYVFDTVDNGTHSSSEGTPSSERHNQLATSEVYKYIFQHVSRRDIPGHIGVSRICHNTRRIVTLFCQPDRKSQKVFLKGD